MVALVIIQEQSTPEQH